MNNLGVLLIKQLNNYVIYITIILSCSKSRKNANNHLENTRHPLSQLRLQKGTKLISKKIYLKISEVQIMQLRVV